MMKNVQILDCTLRDGGYCNQWRFGEKNISKIIKKLDEADIDIIECGFLTKKNGDNKNLSRFKEIRDLKPYLQGKMKAQIVLMANYGECDFEELPLNEGIVDGIRLAFHKDDCEDALNVCTLLKQKGYRVFVQPMVSVRYTEEEFIHLIDYVNAIDPYAFYIVDSFGSMKREELEHLYFITEKYLHPEILIGFHAHNNMQLARANAEWLLDHADDKRSIIIDASVCGMGRGAGNLNTELMAEYLNFKANKEYKVKNVLEIIDEIVFDFYEEKYWGYSLPNFLSAKYNVHPNYADFLERKKTLTFKEMCEIFEKIPTDQCFEYNEDYINKIYLNYLEYKNENKDDINKLKEKLQKKDVLLIAPGRTAETEKDEINEFIDKHDVVVVSVNYVFKYSVPDYVFFSNIRRFKQAPPEKGCVITTSNIGESADYKISYKKYLNAEKGVEDNAALMLIKMLIDCEVRKIYIAGVDGYSTEMNKNYISEDLEIPLRSEAIEEKNEGLKKVLLSMKKLCEIEFITPSKFIEV